MSHSSPSRAFVTAVIGSQHISLHFLLYVSSRDISSTSMERNNEVSISLA